MSKHTVRLAQGNDDGRWYPVRKTEAGNWIPCFGVSFTTKEECICFMDLVEATIVCKRNPTVQ